MTTFKKLAPISNTSIYAITSDNTLYYFNGSSWSQKNTTPITDISVALSGELYGIITSTHLLSKWSGTSWGTAMGTQTLSTVSVHSYNSIYGIGTDNTTYFWNGAYWTQVDSRTTTSLAVSKV